MNADKINAKNAISIVKQHMIGDGFRVVVDLGRSRDCITVDAATGREYLDFCMGFATYPLGYNHPMIRNEDFIREIGEIALTKISNSDYFTVVKAKFVDTLYRIAVEDYFKYLFLIEGGAPAVENAFKTAFDWKVRKNLKKGLPETRGQKIVYFNQAFHGRTGYTLSATITFDPRKTMYFPRFDWIRVPNPKLRFPITEEVVKEVEKAEKESIAAIKKAFLENKDDIAAIIIEPIQGEGGDNHFRGEFLNQLRTLADENEALLIFDEVQAGGGSTGKWWAHQHFNVRPDILVFGKKLQVCGILCSSRIDEVENHVFQESSRINSTWGGNIVDMARATRFLEIIHQEDLLTNATKMGEYFLAKLDELQAKYPQKISNVRGRGCMLAIDLPSTELRKKVLDYCMEEGFITLGCGEKAQRFRPPLNVKKEEIDQAIQILDKVIKKL